MSALGYYLLLCKLCHALGLKYLLTLFEGSCQELFKIPTKCRNFIVGNIGKIRVFRLGEMVNGGVLCRSDRPCRFCPTKSLHPRSRSTPTHNHRPVRRDAVCGTIKVPAGQVTQTNHPCRFCPTKSLCARGGSAIAHNHRPIRRDAVRSNPKNLTRFPVLK